MSNNNKIILNGCIDQFKLENELIKNESEIFELFSLTQITKTYDLTFEEIENSIVDGGNDGGIDSLIISVDNTIPQTIEEVEELKFNRATEVVISITQCKKENSFKELTIDRLITSIPVLFNLASNTSDLLVRFNSSVVEKGQIAREVWKKCSIGGGKLKIIFNYACYSETIEINSVFQDKINQLKELTLRTFSNITVEYSCYSSSELLKLYQIQRNPRLSIKYKESPLSTKYIENGIGYVGTVMLFDYKNFLTDDDGSIKDDLFESNIRHYQGGVDVNKKIKHTIENPEIEDFWWLNNGITIIAENPSLVGTVLSIDNVQIVNGLQTSYSIFQNHSGDPSDMRSVLVKVIINDNKATIDHIIASTNSQNPVSPTLLRATDEIQRDIEIFYFNEGYFYDRRKNYYKNQGKPANKIFSIQFTAQAIESIINNNPHSARSKPTTLIKEDKTYNNIFDRRRNFKSYLNSCLIVKQTTDFVSAIADPSTKSSLANFKLHLARIATSKILRKKVYSIDELTAYSIELYTQTLFNESVAFIQSCKSEFIEENPETNLINMAKARGFTDYLLSKL